MAESRDRIERHIDIAELFARRHSNRHGIYQDVPELDLTPFRTTMGRGTTVIGTARRYSRGGLAMQRLGSTPVRTGFQTPRTGAGRTRIVHRSHVTTGTENQRPGTGRVTNSVLPSWYPRTPLRDITAVVRAIERRRVRLGEVEGQIESITPRQLPAAQLEHDISNPSPSLNTIKKPSPSSVGKLPMILRKITEEAENGPEFLTPQKKLLNSIHSVEKVVMEELQRLKRTPSARREEREKRVRTLMSMR